ncbi:MAG: amidohydrolase [Saccharofermentanales bacterium]|jgi:amidohydrolase
MTKEALKQAVAEAIDARRDAIIACGEAIGHAPELGFKEHRTAARVQAVLNELGIPNEGGLAVTGVRGRLCGRRSIRRVALVGELDAVVCHDHPTADPETGAAHACGHNGQIAAMLGAAMGLVTVADRLDGDIDFFAVPAEECVEMTYRKALRERGAIRYFSGKQEWLRLGCFDDVDACMLIHSHARESSRKFMLGGGSSGFIAKLIRFIGKDAHAGAAPYEGINALNAAALAILAMHTQRETFRDEDAIRVHAIITKGGDLVNVVPADVRMEAYVRGNNLPAIRDAAAKVDRAIEASAMAVGATVEIEDVPGYLPLIQNDRMNTLFAKNGAALLGEDNIVYGVDLLGASDAGDVSHHLPVINVLTGGYAGEAHSRTFRVVDPEMAYVLPAKALAMTVVDLLWNGAHELNDIAEHFVPAMSKAAYFRYLNGDV